MNVLVMLAMAKTVSSSMARSGSNSAFPALPSQVSPSARRTATWRPATRFFPVAVPRMFCSLRCVAPSSAEAGSSSRAGEGAGVASMRATAAAVGAAVGAGDGLGVAVVATGSVVAAGLGVAVGGDRHSRGGRSDIHSRPRRLCAPGDGHTGDDDTHGERQQQEWQAGFEPDAGDTGHHGPRRYTPTPLLRLRARCDAVELARRSPHRADPGSARRPWLRGRHQQSAAIASPLAFATLSQG